ncbi:putative Dyggve-Melchior-Clausen syndrome protein [Blattamonas nauphoetae]|uniref:Dyggve-Melchior-Clausen syndrome protein n=1 Tax=Blattamonas nauphoetae TaxID=2049346 RepID=A0ABQ9YG60_9EUKA|nr:putative Dyggve-Melchior-Clausen syndrome protein [Blattamonas nauphoetae]
MTEAPQLPPEPQVDTNKSIFSILYRIEEKDVTQQFFTDFFSLLSQPNVLDSISTGLVSSLCISRPTVVVKMISSLVSLLSTFSEIPITNNYVHIVTMLNFLSKFLTVLREDSFQEHFDKLFNSGSDSLVSPESLVKTILTLAFTPGFATTERLNKTVNPPAGLDPNTKFDLLWAHGIGTEVPTSELAHFLSVRCAVMRVLVALLIEPGQNDEAESPFKRIFTDQILSDTCPFRSELLLSLINTLISTMPWHVPEKNLGQAPFQSNTFLQAIPSKDVELSILSDKLKEPLLPVVFPQETTSSLLTLCVDLLNLLISADFQTDYIPDAPVPSQTLFQSNSAQNYPNSPYLQSCLLSSAATPQSNSPFPLIHPPIPFIQPLSPFAKTQFYRDFFISNTNSTTAMIIVNNIALSLIPSHPNSIAECARTFDYSVVCQTLSRQAVYTKEYSHLPSLLLFLYRVFILSPLFFQQVLSYPFFILPILSSICNVIHRLTVPPTAVQPTTHLATWAVNLFGNRQELLTVVELLSFLIFLLSHHPILNILNEANPTNAQVPESATDWTFADTLFLTLIDTIRMHFPAFQNSRPQISSSVPINTSFSEQYGVLDRVLPGEVRFASSAISSVYSFTLNPSFNPEKDFTIVDLCTTVMANAAPFVKRLSRLVSFELASLFSFVSSPSILLSLKKVVHKRGEATEEPQADEQTEESDTVESTPDQVITKPRLPKIFLSTLSYYAFSLFSSLLSVFTLILQFESTGNSNLLFFILKEGRYTQSVLTQGLVWMKENKQEEQSTSEQPGETPAERGQDHAAPTEGGTAENTEPEREEGGQGGFVQETESENASPVEPQTEEQQTNPEQTENPDTTQDNVQQDTTQEDQPSDTQEPSEDAAQPTSVDASQPHLSPVPADTDEPAPSEDQPLPDPIPQPAALLIPSEIDEQIRAMITIRQGLPSTPLLSFLSFFLGPILAYSQSTSQPLLSRFWNQTVNSTRSLFGRGEGAETDELACVRWINRQNVVGRVPLAERIEIRTVVVGKKQRKTMEENAKLRALIEQPSLRSSVLALFFLDPTPFK